MNSLYLWSSGVQNPDAESLGQAAAGTSEKWGDKNKAATMGVVLHEYVLVQLYG